MENKTDKNVSPNSEEFIKANADALRCVAALLEAVASLVCPPAVPRKAEAKTIQPDVKFDANAPTRRMPAMEQHALALDEAVRGVSRAVEKFHPTPEPVEIPLPDVTTVKITRPEQMIELMEKLREPPEAVPLPIVDSIVDSIVEVEPIANPAKVDRR